jgi:hypothetical protein
MNGELSGPPASSSRTLIDGSAERRLAGGLHTGRELTSAAGVCDNAGDMKERNVPTTTLLLT